MAVRLIVHYLAAVASIGAALGFIYFMASSNGYLDPRRPIGDRLTTFMFPASAKATDFVPPGWALRKRGYWCFAAIGVAVLIWGATSR